MAFTKPRKLPPIGEKVSEFRLKRLEGGEVTLSELTTAGPVLLAFFKVSCPVCQLTFPFLNRIHSPARLPVYGISQNSPQDTRDFNRRFGITLPVLLDTEESGFPVSNAFGISTVPTMFLVEPGGAISRVIEGWRKSDIERLGAEAGVNPFQDGVSVPEWKAG